jgi:GMP synthase (glutamine-hydrolysing)
MKTAFAIRHVPFEDLGVLEALLSEAGYACRYAEAGLESFAALNPAPADLLIVLGGPIGANDTRDYPFLADELKLLEHRLDSGLPTLGICLGAQLMARTLGARVYPAHAKEIGWAPITLTSEGRRSCLRQLEEVAVLHWHGDTFDLPDGTARLASTAICENQAFSLGRNILALQFHPEVTAARLERWYIGHAVEIAATAGVTVEQLRADAARQGAALEERARKCFAEWLAGLA